jgi:membrane-anchored glycerophosphoryl diester phosphodiesterase (GDPDase)
MLSIEQGRVVEASSGCHSSLLVFERYFGQLSLSRLRFSLSFGLYFFLFFFLHFIPLLLLSLSETLWFKMNWFSDPETNLSLSTIFIFLVFWYDFSLFFFLSSLLSPF